MPKNMNGHDGKTKHGKKDKHGRKDPRDGIQDQLIRNDKEFSFKIKDGAFAVPEGTVLTYTATLADGSPLPSWLSIDPTTGILSGKPPEVLPPEPPMPPTEPPSSGTPPAPPTPGAPPTPPMPPAPLEVKVTVSAPSIVSLSDVFVLRMAKPIRGSERGGRVEGSDNDDICDGDIGDDDINGGLGNDKLMGGDGNDRLIGGMGDDDLEGSGGRDKLLGGNGNDTLNGGLGDDKLVGAAGDDVLTCGGGRDKAVGGSGRDTFVLNSGEGQVMIKDFRAGQDMLGLTSGISFGSLAITSDRGKTTISLAGSDDILAVLNGKVNLTAANFSAQV
jgi:Putative Ig domain/RTX calcium-binding nonapeptide repeat (4 copies)